MMEVDSNIVKVATQSTQVELDTIEVATKIMQPSTLATILESKEVTENPQQEDETRIAPMVEQIIFVKSTIGFINPKDGI